MFENIRYKLRSLWRYILCHLRVRVRNALWYRKSALYKRELWTQFIQKQAWLLQSYRKQVEFDKGRTLRKKPS